MQIKKLAQGFLATAAVAVLTGGASGTAFAQAHFFGNVTADYDVSHVNSNGYEDVSSWVSIEGIHNDTPGPASTPSLAVVVRLSQSEFPEDAGYDVAWWPLGSLAPDENLNELYSELAADDIPAGEYFVHTLLVTDDTWGEVLDSRSEPWTRVWRGGINLKGDLYVDRSYPYELYAEIPEIRNNLLYDHSLPLNLRFYATWEDGPAADGTTLCEFSLDGIAVGERLFNSSYSCDLNSALYDDERVHVELREQGAPQGDTASEKYRGYYGSDVYLHAGSTSLTVMALLGLLGLSRRHLPFAQIRRRNSQCGQRAL